MNIIADDKGEHTEKYGSQCNINKPLNQSKRIEEIYDHPEGILD